MNDHDDDDDDDGDETDNIKLHSLELHSNLANRKHRQSQSFVLVEKPFRWAK